ncbi:Com family DNA-binding transcriptional regulator [Desulforamulus reducens]|uniref:Com family DNA-binding transcriptional regulator n=1 Tax=Desulforamulus reducens TaxID=59610 RepID=UPI003B75C7FB
MRKLNDFRCAKCQKLLARYNNCQMIEIKCPRCGLTNKLQNNACFSTERKQPVYITAAGIK